ncbi:MAG: hypothetical protein ABR586_01545 [Thermoplasmatota archaeon]
MRGLALVALLLVGALALSGCSSKSDSSSSTSSSKSGTRTGTGGTGVQTNTTTQAPNVPPIVKLASTDTNGTATNVTMVGGSLTFSAVGSSDPDGDGLSAVAIVAQDANRTFPPGVLFAAGKYTSVTYKFDRPGVVNVTVSGIDVRGDLTTLKSQVYVDETFSVLSKTLEAPAPTSSATDCKGPTGNAITDAFVYDLKPFSVQKGVQSIVATHASGKGTFAICGPDGTAVSGEGSDDTPAETTAALAAPTGLQTYNVGFMVDASAPHSAVGVTVVVHYEPKPAAAA